mgnify:CR=1 FL=1
MGFMTNRVKCTGRTYFVALDDHNTDMIVEGVLSLDLKGLVPRLFLGKATKAVEKLQGYVLINDRKEG